MARCQHCEAELFVVGTTIVLCGCSKSTQAERLDRERRRQWTQTRAEALEAQRQNRRAERRRKSGSASDLV
jgi:hypothetical protein